MYQIVDMVRGFIRASEPLSGWVFDVRQYVAWCSGLKLGLSMPPYQPRSEREPSSPRDRIDAIIEKNRPHLA